MLGKVKSVKVMSKVINLYAEKFAEDKITPPIQQAVEDQIIRIGELTGETDWENNFMETAGHIILDSAQ